jgi:hypothetical protein
MPIDPSVMVPDTFSKPTVNVVETNPEVDQYEDDITLYRHWEEDYFEKYFSNSIEK